LTEPGGLRLRGVGKRYGLRGWVLSDVDLDVPAGEAISVVGANGAGKSTLLRLIAGVSRPTRGTVSGRPPVTSYVPDRFPAADAMSSISFLTHAGRIRGLGTAEAGRRGRLLMERLELAGGLRTPIRALSKGNAQKVALAQALIVPPGLLILDEPWSGLDAAAHGVLGRILDEVVRDGGTVVFTDHRESISRSHSTLSYRVGDGRVALIEPGVRPERLATSHVVLTGRGGGSDAPREIDWLALAGVLGVTPTAEFVHLQVSSGSCDDLLMTALRGGWSVAEVRRDGPPGHEGGDGDAWAR
jgi:ABC-type Mn2+/Zn2+ transport system ATPase subunit